MIKGNKIRYTRDKASSEGIKIHPQTVDDYHRLQRCFDENRMKYHIFHLNSENQRMINELSNEDILEYLKSKGYLAKKVKRMQSACHCW